MYSSHQQRIRYLVEFTLPDVDMPSSTSVSHVSVSSVGDTSEDEGTDEVGDEG